MASTMNPKITEDIVVKFMFKNLSRKKLDPDYEYIHDVAQYLYPNTDTLPKTVAGCAHEHINIIMEDTLYATLELETLWADPEYRGPGLDIQKYTTTSHRYQTTDQNGEICRIFEHSNIIYKVLNIR